VGLSSLDNHDASDNETSKYIKFDDKRWYRIRVRVTQTKIETWLDDDKMVDVETSGREISLRPGEIYMSEPIGVASYQTTAALRDIKIRRLEPSKKPTKIVLIAGKKSHGPGDHEYEQGVALLKDCLDHTTNVSGLKTEVYLDGWPDDARTLEDADTILYYSDGADHGEKYHPLLREERLETINRLMRRGVGFIAIHYTVFVPNKNDGSGFLDSIGGYFDYESGTASNKWYSKIEMKDYAVKPATPDHPISRGLSPFQIKEEYYLNLRFTHASGARWTPILTFGEPGDRTSVVAWAVERPGGGRGFGYTGGHFHKNWQNENVRKMVLNALFWTARLEVPTDGVASAVPVIPAGPAAGAK